MSTKRPRAPNFTVEEKLEILHLVKKYKDIIECRKTDSVFKKDKNSCWEQLAKEFNARNPACVLRTVDNIRGYYENQKKVTRKRAAREKQEIIKTGGGPLNMPLSVLTDPVYTTTLELINKKTVFGLENPFDDENVELDVSRNTFEMSENCEEIALETSHDPGDDQMTNNDHDYYTYNLDYQEHNEAHNEKENMNETNKNQSARRSNLKAPRDWRSRRRPALSATSTLVKKYEEMAEIKIQMASAQFNIVDKTKQYEEKKISHEEEKWALEKEVLLYQKKSAILDVEIKKEQLKKLQAL